MTNHIGSYFRTARPGYALGAVMVFLAASVILGATVYALTRAEMQSSVYQAKRTAAFYTAEAGLQDALQASATSMWTQGFTNKKFMSGFYTVLVDTTTNPITLTSKGWVSGGSPGKTVQALVKVKLEINTIALNYALVSTAGGITLKNNSTINGNMSSAGGYNTAGNATINGSTTSVVPPALNPVIPKPPNPCNYVSTMTSLGPCYVDGDLTIAINKSVTLTGTLYVTGKLTMSNNNTMLGLAAVYVGGDFTLSNNSVIGDSSTINSPFIYAPGPGIVDISNNGASSYVVIYAPGRDVTLRNNAVMSGSITGRSAVVWNNGMVTHVPVTLPAGLNLGGSGSGWAAIANSWEEKY